MPEPVLAYTTVSTVMRPPRVAILFRADSHWREWARLALRTAGRSWAGGGHLLVPYDEHGQVSSALVAAATAFDPDHVLLLTPTIAECEGVAPGELAIRGNDGLLVGDERAEVVAAGTTFRHHDPAGERARTAVAAACTPFLTEFPGHEPHELHTFVGSDGAWGGLTSSDVVVDDATYSAVAQAWTSDAALFTAALIGIEPNLERDRTGAEPDAGALLDFAFAEQRGTPPPEMLSRGSQAPATPVPTWFQALDVGVQAFRRGYSRSVGAVVLGDGPDDFALAVASQRLRDFGLWLTAEMLHDEHLMRSTLVPLLQRHLYRAERTAGDLVFTTATLDGAALERRLGAVMDTFSRWTFGIADNLLPDGPGQPDWSASGLVVRALTQDVGQSSTVPVLVDADGTRTMASEFSLPASSEPALQARGAHWYIDVDFADSVMPSGRGIRPGALRAGRNPEFSHVRSGRDGLSVVAQSFGFVAAGSVLSGSMARPVLRDLGMFTWARSMATAAGLSAQYSTPGQHAQLVADRLGSRSALTDLVAGPMRLVLKRFADAQGRSDRQSSSDPIVNLGGRPYLTFDQMAEAAPGLDRTVIREVADDLCRRRLARRGLILGCTECGRPSFIGVDDLAQLFSCPRCAASNTLDARSWRAQTDEPHWSYDLHSSFREILTTGGDVPLLAAAQLRKAGRTFADCAEVEFLDDGTPVAEVDLIAHADGKVVVVEAKTGNALGSSKRARHAQAAKLARIAHALRADEVVLATVQATWPDPDLQAVRHALEAAAEGGPVPSVRSLTGLGA